MNNSSNVTTAIISTTTIDNLLKQHQCEYFHYNKLALGLWIVASALCFIALLSTIYSVFNAFQLWSTIQDLDNAIIDLIDEALQILLPIEICKQICHPNHLGSVNVNYSTNGQKQETKPGKKDNRYPEDVTFPPSDIERVYDTMGDEDTRKSKTMTLGTIEEPAPKSAMLSLQKTPKESETDLKKTLPRSPPPIPNRKQPSREIMLTPKQSTKTANAGGRSKEPSLNTAMSQEAGNIEPRKTPSKDTIGSTGVLPSNQDKKTPSKEKESVKNTPAPTPKLGTAEPI